MADSKFDICSRALVLVSANTITSFNDNNTESKVANQLYESTLKNLLTRCRWRFATKQQQLSRDTTAPTARYDAKYPLPADALVINTVTISDNVITYDRYENEIYCDATSTDIVVADYTFRPNEADFPPYFTSAFVFELASLFAGAIARNDSLSQLYQSRAVVAMAQAKSQDSQAQTTRRVEVDRFRNRRNTGAMTVKATVQS